MERIQNKKHNRETIYYSLSRMLERASYYGFRILIVLHMVGEVLKMEIHEAMYIYAWFTGSLFISEIIGALLGDLLLGNRKTIIIGGLTQVVGAFCLCIPSNVGLYVGLFFVVLGNGFYTPNIISTFGKLYLNKTKLLDSGFTLFYLAVNLGSFIGVILIGYIAEKYGFNRGFTASGLLVLLSLIPIIISKKRKQNTTLVQELSINKRALILFTTISLIGIFWGIYSISGIRIYDLQSQFMEISTLDVPKNAWQSLNSILLIPIALVSILFWSFYYCNHFLKLLIGLIFGISSFIILLLIPEIPTEQHTTTYFLSLLLLVISEIHIAPIIHSILTKYSNPKYLAILISLTFLPSRLIAFSFSLFNEKFYENPILGQKFGIITLSIIAFGVIIFLFFRNKRLNL